MERSEALVAYRGQKGIIKGYRDADMEVRVNEDPDLEGIHIPIPKPPPWRLIAGFGKEAKDQKWRTPWIPRGLIELQKPSAKLTIDQIWDELQDNQAKYSEEIEYIKRMWYHRLHGYWFFNNGKPTYITGKHFYYMTSFRLDVGLPRYRSRDRIYWVAIDFLKKHTYDFAHKDDEGNALKTKYPDGKWYYEMRDTGRRLIFGDAYPKMRREGATYRAECNNVETITLLSGAKGGIQSRNDKDAKEVFVTKLVRPWKKIPFFFKPTYSGSTDPKSELIFDTPSIRIGGKGSLASVITGLESMIDFQVGDEGAYDGQKLYFHHDDEVGKNWRNNVMQRHIVAMECLSQDAGMDIHGYTSKTSTVGEMEKGGGKVFKEMCDMSDYYNRTETGQTASGLVVIFISSVEGMRVDAYGDSDTALNEKNIMSVRRALKAKGNIELYIEKVRQYPIRYRECFTSSSNDMGFNLLILDDRMQELKMHSPPIVQGMFSRANPRDRTSPVSFTEDPLGRFIMSRQMLSFQSNNIYSTSLGYAPYKAGKFNVGIDPFAFDKTEKGVGMSDGGISVKFKRDLIVDPNEKPIAEWESDRFVCTYQYRPPTTDEFADDALMAAMYFGGMALCEANVHMLIKLWKMWGMGGFLKHMRDPATNQFRKTPGFPTTTDSKEDIFNALRDYVERRGRWENHLELLTDCYDIQSVKQMTKYDRLTASGLAELAEDSDHGDVRRTEKKKQGYGLPARPRRMD